MIISATMIGTARNIPGTPQIAPQKASDRMMPKLDSRSVWPSSIGSMMFPIRNCVTAHSTPTITVAVGSPVSTKARRTAISVAMIDPTDGMKFRTKVSRATAVANSSPIVQKISQTIKAVTALTPVLTTR